MNGGAVGFVVRRLKHRRDVQHCADDFVVIGATKGTVVIFENIYAPLHKNGIVVSKSNSA